MIVLVLTHSHSEQWGNLRKSGGFKNNDDFVRHLLARETERQVNSKADRGTLFSSSTPMSSRGETKVLPLGNHGLKDTNNLIAVVQFPKQSSGKDLEIVQHSSREIFQMMDHAYARCVQNVTDNLNLPAVSKGLTGPPDSPDSDEISQQIETEIEMVADDGGQNEPSNRHQESPADSNHNHETEMIEINPLRRFVTLGSKTADQTSTSTATFGGKKFYWCPLCAFNDLEKDVVSDHISSHRDDFKQIREKTKTCIYCNQIVDHYLGLHLVRHITAAFKCSICGYVYSRDASANHVCDENIELISNEFTVSQLIGYRYPTYTCLKCYEVFQTFKAFTRHFRKAHLKGSLDAFLPCHVCRKSVERGALKRHMIVAHKPVHIKEPKLKVVEN